MRRRKLVPANPLHPHSQRLANRVCWQRMPAIAPSCQVGHICEWNCSARSCLFPFLPAVTTGVNTCVSSHSWENRPIHYVLFGTQQKQKTHLAGGRALVLHQREHTRT